LGDVDAPHEPQQGETLSQATPASALAGIQPESEAPTYQVYERSSDGPLRQGEVLSSLVQAHLNVQSLETQEPVVDFRNHPYAIVITQDCDVIQDHTLRQANPASDITPNVLFCEVVSAEDLHSTVQNSGLRSQDWRNLKQNKLERYQFLERVLPEKDVLEIGLPSLGIDFKRYFTIPTSEVYFRIRSGEAQRRCRLVDPYLQHLSARFFSYQSRVALPADHRTT
jgi:hypothetical protein